uniref:(northern house mosquito) hypothetical protein n=1 Tax=Culex pipiens TaxID=7175 RepID=A0A8D8FN57_CULPI
MLLVLFCSKYHSLLLRTHTTQTPRTFPQSSPWRIVAHKDLPTSGKRRIHHTQLQLTKALGALQQLPLEPFATEHHPNRLRSCTGKSSSIFDGPSWHRTSQYRGYSENNLNGVLLRRGGISENHHIPSPFGSLDFRFQVFNVAGHLAIHGLRSVQRAFDRALVLGQPGYVLPQLIQLFGQKALELLHFGNRFHDGGHFCSELTRQVCCLVA